MKSRQTAIYLLLLTKVLLVHGVFPSHPGLVGFPDDSKGSNEITNPILDNDSRPPQDEQAKKELISRDRREEQTIAEFLQNDRNDTDIRGISTSLNRKVVRTLEEKRRKLFAQSSQFEAQIGVGRPKRNVDLMEEDRPSMTTEGETELRGLKKKSKFKKRKGSKSKRRKKNKTKKTKKNRKAGKKKMNMHGVGHYAGHYAGHHAGHHSGHHAGHYAGHHAGHIAEDNPNSRERGEDYEQ